MNIWLSDRKTLKGSNYSFNKLTCAYVSRVSCEFAFFFLTRLGLPVTVNDLHCTLLTFTVKTNWTTSVQKYYYTQCVQLLHFCLCGWTPTTEDDPNCYRLSPTLVHVFIKTLSGWKYENKNTEINTKASDKKPKHKDVTCQIYDRLHSRVSKKRDEI